MRLLVSSGQLAFHYDASMGAEDVQEGSPIFQGLRHKIHSELKITRRYPCNKSVANIGRCYDG